MILWHCQWLGLTDGSEIPNKHMGCKKPGKYRINYQPQLVSRISSINSIIIIQARKKWQFLCSKWWPMASWLNVLIQGSWNITNSINALFSKGNPSNVPCICIICILLDHRLKPQNRGQTARQTSGSRYIPPQHLNLNEPDHLSHEKKPSYFPLNPGCLRFRDPYFVVIWNNPHITG